MTTHTIQLRSDVQYTTQADRDRLLERSQEALIALRKMGKPRPEASFAVRVLPSPNNKPF